LEEVKLSWSAFVILTNPWLTMSNSVIEILLIEDDPDDAELTIHALKKHNLVNNLLHIDEGQKALDFLYSEEERSPKLILLDLRMPRVDGIQILRKLKGDPEKRHIPVIALVSSKEGKSYVESFHLKADAYMVKPVDFKKFFMAISDIGLIWKIVDTPTAVVNDFSGRDY
jgi:two-component system, response regulator